MSWFPFPEWTNRLRPALAIGLIGLPVYLIVLIGYGTSAKTTDVGYQPGAAGRVQPRAARRRAGDRLPVLPHDASSRSARTQRSRRPRPA